MVMSLRWCKDRGFFWGHQIFRYVLQHEKRLRSRKSLFFCLFWANFSLMEALNCAKKRIFAPQITHEATKEKSFKAMRSLRELKRL